MPQLFTPRADTILRTAAVAIVLVMLTATLAAWAVVRSPAVTGQYVAVQQPVPFSHPMHVNGLAIDCRYCHASVERGPLAGLPPAEACVPCHQDGYLSSNQFAAVRLSLSTGRPIPWRRVTHVPDFVFFNHAVHVHGGVGCASCHGPVQMMEQVYQAAPLTMDWCLKCHREAERHDVDRLTSCATCHR